MHIELPFPQNIVHAVPCACWAKEVHEKSDLAALRRGEEGKGISLLAMGLDVSNGFFGNFHLNWAGTRWFREWCAKRKLPKPLIGWESGCNDGDQCVLGPGCTHTPLAEEWCTAFEQKFPELAALGKSLLENPPNDLRTYLYPGNTGDPGGQLSEEEWSRRAVAAWYAILRHGIANGDILEYW